MVRRATQEANRERLHGLVGDNESHVVHLPATCCNHRRMLQPHFSAAAPAVERRKPWTLPAVACAALIGALAPTAHADWNLAVDARWRHDDNVGNAESPGDRLGDSITSARLGAFRFVPLSDGYSVNVGVDLSGEYYDRLHGLDNAGVEGAVALKKKWGLGPYAPWARIGASVTHTDYADSYRNASIYRATAAAGRRLDERWNLSADYEFERRSASTQPEEVPGISGDAYSQASHRLGLTAQFATSEHTHLTAGVFVRRGDVISTSEASLKVFYASRALAEDPAFGPEAYAYRLLATTVGFKVGVAYAPWTHQSIGFDFLRLDSHAGGGNDYTKSIPEITWVYSF